MKKISKSLNSCTLFIGFYCAYLFLRAKESSALTGYMLLAITILSLCYFIYVQFKIRQPQMLKWLSILFIMFAVYGLVYIISGEIIVDFAGMPLRNIDYIKKIAASLLPVYPMYVFALKGKLTKKVILFWIPIFVVICIYGFFNYYNEQLENALARGSAAKEFTNNIGYAFVSLLPLLFLKQEKPIVPFIAICICAIYIVAAVKRGAILIGAIAIAYFIIQTISSTKGKKKAKIVFLLIVIFFIAGYYIEDFIKNSNYFAQRVERTLDGNSSARDIIYRSIWDAFKNSDYLQIILGHGADSSVKLTGLLAHNDWLEIVINQGLLGIAIFLSYNIAIFKAWRFSRKDPNIGICMGGLFIVLFLRTFFSMSYTEYSLYICIAFGYCAAYIQSMQKKKSHYAN